MTADDRAFTAVDQHQACHRCGGLLVPELDLGSPPTVKCVNCGDRPALAPIPDPNVVRPHRRNPTQRQRGVVRHDRSVMIEAVAACARELKQAPTKQAFDAFCARHRHPFGVAQLVYAADRAGEPRRWISWMAILREAGCEPTADQLRKAQNRRGGRKNTPCIAHSTRV